MGGCGDHGGSYGDDGAGAATFHFEIQSILSSPCTETERLTPSRCCGRCGGRPGPRPWPLRPAAPWPRRPSCRVRRWGSVRCSPLTYSDRLGVLYRLSAALSHTLHGLHSPPPYPADEVDVVVIGGGSIGASVAYHLQDRGLSVCLLERDRLTSGTTWHSAGMLWRLRPSDTDVELHT